MGACTFSDFQQGSDAKSAFSEAVSDSRYENGAGGYSGSLAEKSSFHVIQSNPVSLTEANRIAERLIEAEDPRIDDKWGPAGAIPVLDDSAISRRSRTVTVKHLEDGYVMPEQLLKLAAPLVPLKAGERIENVKIVKDDIRRRPVVKATEGKSSTRYYIVPRGATSLHGAIAHPTVAAARKALTEHLKAKASEGGQPLHKDLEIVGFVRRDGTGSGLVTGQLELKSRTLKLEVSVVKTDPKKGSAVAGWLFFGWASS